MNDQEPSVVLSLTVEDVASALELYTAAFDAKELYHMAMPDGTVMHAEFTIGSSQLLISVGSEDWKASPLPEGTLAPCLIGINVDDVDAAFAKAKAAGVNVIKEPTSQCWGWRTAVVSDPFGYRWNLRKQVEDVSPEEVMQRAMAFMGES